MQPEGAIKYAWLFIRNKGVGTAEILQISGTFETHLGEIKPIYRSWGWGKGKVISRDGKEIFAFPLGEYKEKICFIDGVTLTYKSQEENAYPIDEIFLPEYIDIRGNDR